MEMSYEKFVELRCTDKSGNLLKLSKFKRENPSQFESHNNRFNAAYESLLNQSNRGMAVRDKGELVTKKTILANSK